MLFGHLQVPFVSPERVTSRRGKIRS